MGVYSRQGIALRNIICDVLGIDANHVAELTVHISPYDLVKIDVHYYLDKSADQPTAAFNAALAELIAASPLEVS
jgi:hypothetical protein